eukprot:CAMPEP_0170074106 /NCGR_PEP_ID=MMETSP0019_2-20121128/11452_1 /TAXON_ID=98059 /ORGANISM="Dinobryon sp., Strain UTEXLB2267" /LENGTH=55 /DNA_ID=CAMNT_0010284161 /DNA_START=710 /DNA_END=877 /DNA_ORIENTATION=+
MGLLRSTVRTHISRNRWVERRADDGAVECTGDVAQSILKHGSSTVPTTGATLSGA